MRVEQTLRELGARSKAASLPLRMASTFQKNQALLAIATAIESGSDDILAANEKDMQKAAENGINAVMADRLRLTPQRLTAIAQAVGKVAALPDPVGEVAEGFTRPNGLYISKLRVPLGVAGIIYESRPNVTVDAAVLCLKAGNVCILRGGKEAIQTNMVLTQLMQQAIATAGLPKDAILLVEDTSRESAAALMCLEGYLDVLIPRGGAGLIRSVVENASVPVIQTGVGNCHIYVDWPCNLDMAAEIIVNAKCSRPSVCNAAETLLVHAKSAEVFLPEIANILTEQGVQLRGCPRTLELAGDTILPASEEDYATEFHDLILAVKVVDTMEEAIDHIGRYGSGHSEAIITDSYPNSRQFTAQVDAAAVYVNASTRFTDGEEFGLGAEMGISTQKLHARGPMGLRELTSTKYVVLGNGQIR